MSKLAKKLPILIFIIFSYFIIFAPKEIIAAPSWNRPPYINDDKNRILFNLRKSNGEELIVVLYIDGTPKSIKACGRGSERCQTNDSRGGALNIPTHFISTTATVKVCEGRGNNPSQSNCDNKPVLLESTVNISGAHGGGGAGGSGSGENPCSIGPEGKCETALGNIPTNFTDFAGRILSIATGVAGGIALILMVIGSIRVLTSSGDQQKLSAGRDMIVAAVAGLLFLIFSVLILRFLGIILGIPFV